MSLLWKTVVLWMRLLALGHEMQSCAVACCLAQGHHSCPVSSNLIDDPTWCVRSSRILVQLAALIKNWTNNGFTTWDTAQRVDSMEWEFYLRVIHKTNGWNVHVGFYRHHFTFFTRLAWPLTVLLIQYCVSAPPCLSSHHHHHFSYICMKTDKEDYRLLTKCDRGSF